ncbi:putative trehalose-phosphate phosphatase D [Porphyridium purpureum]|uniref:Trehalose 6-phosphate phosphatase n=1 Tax=Porphyridium purpureum TaxID=35688 RepID=A0A5J4YI08_PORPP|nr:putative trehalose-phosphate phosphatase D [Porphyridium purpureum]|eukprot:POR9063..scf297_16
MTVADASVPMQQEREPVVLQAEAPMPCSAGLSTASLWSCVNQFLESEPNNRTLLGHIRAQEAPVCDLPSAFDAVPLLDLVSQHVQIVWFIDYDGTLSPIVEDPDRAFLPSATHDTLVELARTQKVAIVSGRARKKLQTFVNIPDVYLAGSHGFDITGPEGSLVHHQVAEKFLPQLRDAQAVIELQIQDIPGCHIEDNWLAFSVHWRRADPADVARIERAVDEVVENSQFLRKTHGKCVFEVRPKIDWDKGRAVDWLLSALELNHPRVLPIYIGDDKTDEDAFRVLRARGLACVVGGAQDTHQTAAHFRLEDPMAVERFLRHFC